MDYAGFWKRVAACIIDTLEGVVLGFMSIAMQWSQIAHFASLWYHCWMVVHHFGKLKAAGYNLWV